jgi:hypothetical protein
MKGSGHGLVKVVSRNLPVWTEEIYVSSQSAIILYLKSFQDRWYKQSKSFLEIANIGFDDNNRTNFSILFLKIWVLIWHYALCCPLYLRSAPTPRDGRSCNMLQISSASRFKNCNFLSTYLINITVKTLVMSLAQFCGRYVLNAATKPNFLINLTMAIWRKPDKCQWTLRVWGCWRLW